MRVRLGQYPATCFCANLGFLLAVSLLCGLFEDLSPGLLEKRFSLTGAADVG